MRLTLFSLALVGLAACQVQTPPATSSDAAEDNTPSPTAPVETGKGIDAPASDAVASDPASVLAGKAWRVERRSDGGEVGATYAFLADGTLRVESRNGTPAEGRWSVDGDALSLSEEGIAYPTDLVLRDADHVTLRSHNPGGVVEIALVRAPDVPVPAGG